MKFYSQVTKRIYNSEKDLLEAEAKVEEAKRKAEQIEKEKKETRAAKAKAVEDALKKANKAQAEALKLLREFTQEYGYFHTSYSTEDIEDIPERTLPLKFIDLIDSFLS